MDVIAASQLFPVTRHPPPARSFTPKQKDENQRTDVRPEGRPRGPSGGGAAARPQKANYHRAIRPNRLPAAARALPAASCRCHFPETLCLFPQPTGILFPRLRRPSEGGGPARAASPKGLSSAEQRGASSERTQVTRAGPQRLLRRADDGRQKSEFRRGLSILRGSNAPMNPKA